MQQDLVATSGEGLRTEVSDLRYEPLAQRWYVLIGDWIKRTLRLDKPVPLVVCAVIVICATLALGLLITLLTGTPLSFSPNVLMIQLWVTLFAALIQVIIHTY